MIPKKLEDILISKIKEMDLMLERIRSEFSPDIKIELEPYASNTSTSATYVDVTGNTTAVNFDDWSNYRMFFEILGKVSSSSGYFSLYNASNSAQLAEIIVTDSYNRQIRSVPIDFSGLSGSKNLKVQYKSDGGATVKLVRASVVFKPI